MRDGFLLYLEQHKNKLGGMDVEGDIVTPLTERSWLISLSAQQDAIASLTQAQAGSVKARDEISLSYQFVTVGGSKPPAPGWQLAACQFELVVLGFSSGAY